MTARALLAGAALAALFVLPSLVTASRTDAAVRTATLLDAAGRGPLRLDASREQSATLPGGATRTCMPIAPGPGWVCVVLAGDDRIAGLWRADAPGGRPAEVYFRDTDPRTEPDL